MLIPTRRLRPLLKEYLQTHTIREMALETGVDERTIYGIMKERKFVQEAVADRILTGLGMVDVWHTDLQDLYLDAA